MMGICSSSVSGLFGRRRGLAVNNIGPALSPAGPATVSVLVIVEDHSLQRRGWCATLVLGFCQPPCSLALLRCPGGAPPGPHSRAVRAAGPAVGVRTAAGGSVVDCRGRPLRMVALVGVSRGCGVPLASGVGGPLETVGVGATWPYPGCPALGDWGAGSPKYRTSAWHPERGGVLGGFITSAANSGGPGYGLPCVP